MKRATVTIPDDLDKAVESYIRAQEATPTLTSVVQVALRHYLTEKGYMRPKRSLRITPAEHGSGHSDVSELHDAYLSVR